MKRRDFIKTTLAAAALSALPGVHLTEDSYIHSNGILGLICAGVEDPAGAVKLRDISVRRLGGDILLEGEVESLVHGNS